jgi:hypothetical protein
VLEDSKEDSNEFSSTESAKFTAILAAYKTIFSSTESAKFTAISVIHKTVFSNEFFNEQPI